MTWVSNDGRVERTSDFFSYFGRHIFGNFRTEANIILRRHEVRYRLFRDPKIIELE